MEYNAEFIFIKDLVDVSLHSGLGFRIKAFTIRAVVCVDITTAISSIPQTIVSIQIVVTIVIAMPSRWCTLNTLTIFAIGVPSTIIIQTASSTIPIAFGIVVLVITPLILGPTRGSTAF